MVVSQSIYGNDGDDFLYGGQYGGGAQTLFGDNNENGTGTPVLGGNDRLYGGSNITGD